MAREDLPMVRRARAFGLVLCFFLPVAGVSAGLVFDDGRLFTAFLSPSIAAVAILLLSFRFGHLTGARGIRVMVHCSIGGLLAATTGLALHIGNGSALSVTHPSVLILATCYLLGTRATIGWTVVALGCLAYVLAHAELPPGPDGMPSASTLDVFASRSMVLLLICTVSVVERRFSDRASRNLEFLARHDPLTGLLNRRALEERLAQAVARCRRYERGFALLFIDLDGFKRINDELGHARGDALLEILGTRIRSMTRETDAASRVGGDEFAIVVEEYEEEKNVELHAERLLAMLSRPVEIDGVELAVSASIGVACFPRDGADVEAIFRAADLAMYEAKTTGGARVRIHADIDSDRVSGRS